VDLARTALGLDHSNTLLVTAQNAITSVVIQSLAFKSDHGVLKNNDIDWADTGVVYAKPEWVAGQQSAPISHSKDVPMQVEIVLQVKPPNAAPAPCTVEGTARFGGVKFSQTATLMGGNVTVAITGNKMTLSPPDSVAKLSGDVAWKVTITKTNKIFDAGASVGHTVFATFGTPVDAGDTEGGITHKRMAKAIELIAAASSNDPHTIVMKLMRVIPNYTLLKDSTIKYNHPFYRLSSEGGAWPMIENPSAGGHCQAIVRFVGAVLKQVACPGTIEARSVWAEPQGTYGYKVKDESYGSGQLDMRRTVNGKICDALLADKSVAKGELCDIVNRSASNYVGFNQYEACIRFQYGSDTRYYGGGISKSFSNAEDIVLFSFPALCWVSSPVIDHQVMRRVEEIVLPWNRSSVLGAPALP